MNNKRLIPLLEVMPLEQLNDLIDRSNEMKNKVADVLGDEVSLGEMDALFFAIILAIGGGTADVDDKKALFARARAYMNLVENWSDDL